MPTWGRMAKTAGESKTKKQALLFVNKKKQKNVDFFVVRRPLSRRPEGEQKFFGSFFLKKNIFLLKACALFE
jgi:hypothetical protein